MPRGRSANRRRAISRRGVEERSQPVARLGILLDVEHEFLSAPDAPQTHRCRTIRPAGRLAVIGEGRAPRGWSEPSRQPPGRASGVRIDLRESQLWPEPPEGSRATRVDAK